jgi:predicted acyl esterase
MAERGSYHNEGNPMNRRVFLTIIPLVILLVGATPPQSIREEYPLDDFTVREVMVPMRDGVRLYTIILTPKHARGPLPILMERTPYNASRTLEGLPSTQLGVILGLSTWEAATS